jgi:hypothetical protein
MNPSEHRGSARRLFAGTLTVGCLLAGAPVGMAGDGSYFHSKVLPILEQRCFECHSHGSKIKGGLALDSRTGWETGGDHGPAVKPGAVEESLLIRAVRYRDSDLEMPPKAKLSEEEIAALEEWVRRGAEDPREGAAVTKATIDLEAGRNFWAFQPVANPDPPVVKDAAWPLDPVDRFVLAKIEAAGIRPVGDAEPHLWLRRVSFDLTGLPPSEEAIAGFEADLAAGRDAHALAVDRLLASRAYGERWARHWLDLTGYADMVGTSNNVYAEHAWRYRDWLVAAFQGDKPFDDFIREQIAGDLMPAASPEDRASKITATGFLMVGDIEIVNPDKARMEADHVDTQVIKIGTAFLGMTLGCARCHDHKFDPVGLEDYYGIAGILNSSPSSHKMPDMGVWSALNSTVLPETPEQLAARKRHEAEIGQRIAAWKEEQEERIAEKAAVERQIADLGQSNHAPPPLAATAQEEREAAEPLVPAGDESRDALTKRRDELDAGIKKLSGDIQHAEFFRDTTPRAFAMADGPGPADMPIQVRGNPYAPGPVVPRGAIRVASWEPFPAIPAGQSGRLQLADWLADARNPLTARVTVNRIWQRLFGVGLVPSVDYFGERGERPTHPELLDHLATRFVEGGWSQKAFLRSLVLSRTYRLGSAAPRSAIGSVRPSPDPQSKDPENKLYWRMNRQRLDAEALRDAMLAVSGELAEGTGGPGLVLENPANCGSLSLKGVNPPNYNHRIPRAGQEFQRTLYLPVMRTGLTNEDKLRATFDFVDPAMIAGQRHETFVPTQSLYLLNADQVRKRAVALARLVAEEAADDRARIKALWRRVLNRPVTPAESDEAIAFLAALDEAGASEKDSAARERLKWTELCHGLLASNEFLFRR